jgi:hypothetical protein
VVEQGDDVSEVRADGVRRPVVDAREVQPEIVHRLAHGGRQRLVDLPGAHASTVRLPGAAVKAPRHPIAVDVLAGPPNGAPITDTGGVAMCRAWSVIGLIVVALALPACTRPGDDDPGGASRTPDAVAGLGDRAATPSAGATTREITATFRFTTPSKNIGCFVGADAARCDIVRKSWKPPPKPAGCDLDYGNGLTVEAGEKATVVCAGDTVLGAKEILPYGEAVKVGSFVCESQNSGVRCRNDDSGHGFTIAREKFTLF